MSPWVMKKNGLMQMILYIIKWSGNYRKGPKISERLKIHRKVWISTKEKLLWSNFDEIFIKVPQCLCVTFWPENGGFSLKSRFSNNFLVSHSVCVSLFSTKFIKVIRTQEDGFWDRISNDKSQKIKSQFIKSSTKRMADYSQVSINTGNIPSIMKLLAIKIRAFEMSKQKLSSRS